MIHTRNGSDALAQRDIVISPGTGQQHWGTVFFGPRVSTAVGPGPQATMSDLNPHESIVPHFHGVTMFQLFVAGSGTIGAQKKVLEPLTVQFKDHHTAYGPVIAGPQGLSFMAMRMHTGNSKPVYLHSEGYRDHLKPSRRRNLTSSPVKFSIEPVLRALKEASWEPLFDETDDGMSGHIVRLGSGMTAKGPDPKVAGGYYVFVGNGSIVHAGEQLPLWSMVVVEPTEEGFEIRAGEEGAEVLVLQFPRDEKQ